MPAGPTASLEDEKHREPFGQRVAVPAVQGGAVAECKSVWEHGRHRDRYGAPLLARRDHAAFRVMGVRGDLDGVDVRDDVRRFGASPGPVQPRPPRRLIASVRARR